MTLNEIAKMANVSKATVSLVLNNKDGVSPQKRELIQKIIKETGYVTNRKTKSDFIQNNICFIKYKEKGYMVEHNGDFILRIIDGIELATRKNHMNLNIVNANSNNFEDMIPIINQKDYAGIIFLGTEFDTTNADILKRLKAPVIVIDNEMPCSNIDVIVMNNYYAVYLAIKHLYDMGHTEIGHITSEYRVSNFKSRTNAFEQIMKSMELKTYSKYNYLVSTEIGGYCDSLIKQFDPDNLPTAIVADNDIIAINACLALKKIGKNVPSDVSVIGIDDVAISNIVSPELTTIRIQKQSIGVLAVERLMHIIKAKEAEPIKLLTSAKLIIRKSVSPPKI